MNYKNLTNPMDTTCQQTLLGQTVFIRRLTSTELDDYNGAVDTERKGANSDRTLSVLGVDLFLSALVNEDGTRPKKSELPTAEALLAAHSTADLLHAVTTVQRHSYGSLEEAVKN
jgi:hypothetical protein